MPGAPSGFLGKLSAERPMLATGVLALGMTALCILGARNSPALADSGLLSRLVLSVIVALCIPIALAAFAPQKLWFRILFLAVTLVLGALLSAMLFGAFGSAPTIPGVPPLIVGTGLGFFLFLTALAPLVRSALRLGLLAPIIAVLGAAGAMGYLALEGILFSPLSAGGLTIALAGGICIGAGVGADYAQLFAKGLAPRAAAAAAGHAALAPAAFTILAAAAYAMIVTLEFNYGAVDWRIFLGVVAAALFTSATVLVGATAALALMRPSEQIAVDENHRRQRFFESWRPFRRRLPVTTASAASVIVGVLVIIAAFEVGIRDAMSLAMFLALILVASGAAFVSVRTSFLIVVILFASTVFAGYVFAITGLTLPSLSERFAALTLAAIALSQLTLSWRNAGDIWRNARDIAQNAMCDGLRRFLIALGVGAATLIAVAHAFEWEAGVATAGYFAVVAAIGQILAPVMMVALSAQSQRI